jgi:hypothetical protein
MNKVKWGSGIGGSVLTQVVKEGLFLGSRTQLLRIRQLFCTWGRVESKYKRTEKGRA